MHTAYIVCRRLQWHSLHVSDRYCFHVSSPYQLSGPHWHMLALTLTTATMSCVVVPLNFGPSGYNIFSVVPISHVILLTRLTYTIITFQVKVDDVKRVRKCLKTCMTWILPDCFHIAHGEQNDLSGWYLELRLRLGFLRSSLSCFRFRCRTPAYSHVTGWSSDTGKGLLTKGSIIPIAVHKVFIIVSATISEDSGADPGFCQGGSKNCCPAMPQTCARVQS